MRKLTLTDFIERAKLIHKDKYDYSKVNYVNAHTKVCIICPVHGEFWQKPYQHLNGCGCRECQYVVLKNKFKSDDFIEKAKEIHGDKYDYLKAEYINNKNKVCIICPVHGEFWITPNHHLKGHGCKKCGINERAKKRSLTTEEFVSRANKIHNGKYDYSKVRYINSETKIAIICPKHGEFLQMPFSHMKGCGCPKCQNSKLEDLTSSILKAKNIEFNSGCHFTWLGRQHLDFYLPDYNVGIECQGEQHFKGWGGKEESLKAIQHRDNKKKQLCEENGVTLYYVSYDDNVETKLNEILKEVCHS